MNERLSRLTAGAFAGLIATIPMSIVMLAGNRRLAWTRPNPLPPEKITKTVLSRVGLGDELTAPQEQALVGLGHFGYGAAMGLGYGLLPNTRSPGAAVAQGVAYGLSVWAGSYLGWLPAVGLHRSATQESRERNLLMVTAHVVWGASLGLATALAQRQLEASEQPDKESPRKHNPAPESPEISRDS